MRQMLHLCVSSSLAGLYLYHIIIFFYFQKISNWYMYSRATLHIPKKYSYNFINIVLSFLGKCKTIELNSIELAYMPWNAPNEYERDTRRTSGNGQRINLMLLQTVKMCVWARKLNNSVNHKKVKLQTQLNQLNWLKKWNNQHGKDARSSCHHHEIFDFKEEKSKSHKTTTIESIGQQAMVRTFKMSILILCAEISGW